MYDVPQTHSKKRVYNININVFSDFSANKGWRDDKGRNGQEDDPKPL